MKFYKHGEEVVSLKDVSSVDIGPCNEIRIVYTYLDKSGNHVNYVHTKNNKEAKQILEEIYNALNAE